MSLAQKLARVWGVTPATATDATNATVVSQPNPETVAQAAPALTSVSPQLSAVGAAFLASRHWPNEAARNTARSIVIEFERFCAQQDRRAA